MNEASPGKRHFLGEVCLDSTNRISCFKASQKRSVSNLRSLLRERCRERMKENREDLLNRLRGVTPESEDLDIIISTLIQEELESIKASQRNCCTFRIGNSIGKQCQLESEYTVSAREVDEALQIRDEIHQELLAEEQQILQEYEMMLAYDHQVLAETVEKLHAQEVICPVCQKRPLQIARRNLVCSCGLSIPVEISIEEFRKKVDSCVEEHCNVCRSGLEFLIIHEEAVPNLYAMCSYCSYLSLVL